MPISLFQYFENFTVEYHVLGRDVKFRATKTNKFRRTSASKYKPMSDLLTKGDMAIADSSDSDDNYSNDFSGDDETKSSEESEETLVVGDLNIKQMKVSYVLIPGDSVNEGSSDELQNYFNHHRQILIVLCGKAKQNYQINISNKSSFESSADKVIALEKKISEIKKKAIHSTLGENFSYQNYLQGVHKIRTMRKSPAPASPEVFSKSHNSNPRIFCGKTDQGQTLPPNAIAYAYVDYHQFLHDTVIRVDVTLNMIYSLVNVPKERSVPKIKVGQSDCPGFIFYLYFFN